MRKRDSIGVDKRKRDGEGDSVSVAANIGNDRHQLLHGPGLGTAVGLPIGSVTTGSIAHADQQLGCVMAGDPRGLYGERRL